MPSLKSLTLAALPKAATDPAQNRRSKLISRLEEQKKLVSDPGLIRKVQRTIRENGERRIVTQEQKVRPWWRADPNGQLFMSIKFGSKAIEFEKGKAAIAVPTKEKLPTVIDTLIGAIRAGELDDILAQASKQRPFLKAKKAA
jgi:Family of unknown function (DUF6641)